MSPVSYSASRSHVALLALSHSARARAARALSLFSCGQSLATVLLTLSREPQIESAIYCNKTRGASVPQTQTITRTRKYGPFLPAARARWYSQGARHAALVTRVSSHDVFFVYVDGFCAGCVLCAAAGFWLSLWGLYVVCACVYKERVRPNLIRQRLFWASSATREASTCHYLDVLRQGRKVGRTGINSKPGTVYVFAA